MCTWQQCLWVHSFRIRRCVNIQKAGTKISAINRIERWKSNVVLDILTFVIEWLSFVIAENVAALFDLWILEDNFLKDAFAILQLMKSQAKVTKWPPPHIYEYLNVIPLYQKEFYHTVHSAEARLMNSNHEVQQQRSPSYLFSSNPW